MDMDITKNIEKTHNYQNVASSLHSLKESAVQVRFIKGILGFEQHTAFSFMPFEDPYEPLHLLISHTDPNIAFILLEHNHHSIQSKINPNDKESAISSFKDEFMDPVHYSIVTIRSPRDNLLLTANLRAPIVIDKQHNIAAQYVMSNPSYQFDFPLHQVSDDIKNRRQSLETV